MSISIPRSPSSRLAWAVRKGDPDILNWMENFMYQIKNDGTYDKIYQKWFQDDAWLKEIQ